MKKIFSAIVLMVSSLAAMAQVENFNGTLNEAIGKAKAENKRVMIVTSTTWCGPCKKLATNVFTKEESGNYINPRFVVVKYNVDVADPDKIVERFTVKSYPTIIILGDSGNEITRLIGGAGSAKEFNDRLESVMAPGKTFVERKAMFEVDKSTALEFLKFINDMRMNDEAAKILDDLYNSRTLKENFTKEWVDYYRRIDVDSPILKDMLEHSDEISELIGKESYDIFIKDKTNKFIADQINNKKFDRESFDKVLSFINSSPIMTSEYSKFVAANGANIEAKNTDALLAAAKKGVKKGDFNSKMKIVSVARMFIKYDTMAKYRPQLLALYESIAKSEKDVDNKKRVTEVINGLKKTL